MSDDIQIRDGDNKPAKTIKNRVYYFVNAPIVWILIRVIIFGVGFYVANGLFDKPTTVIATFFVVVTIQLYLQSSREEDYVQKTKWENVLLRDSIDKLRDSIQFYYD